VFADLDESIRQLLIRYVPIDLSEIDISFEAPDREWSGRLSRPSVNCFLYDIYENKELREANWEVRRSENGVSRRKLPMRLDAAYQVTAWARAPEDEHRLLWRVLAALARHTVLPSEVLQGGLVEQPNPLYARVAQAEQKARINAADLWQALDNRIRPSLTYVITMTLDPYEAVTSPIVLSREVRVDRLRPEHALVGAGASNGSSDERPTVDSSST